MHSKSTLEFHGKIHQDVGETDTIPFSDLEDVHLAFWSNWSPKWLASDINTKMTPWSLPLGPISRVRENFPFGFVVLLTARAAAQGYFAVCSTAAKEEANSPQLCFAYAFASYSFIQIKKKFLFLQFLQGQPGQLTQLLTHPLKTNSKINQHNLKHHQIS